MIIWLSLTQKNESLYPKWPHGRCSKQSNAVEIKGASKPRIPRQKLSLASQPLPVDLHRLQFHFRAIWSMLKPWPKHKLSSCTIDLILQKNALEEMSTSRKKDFEESDFVLPLPNTIAQWPERQERPETKCQSGPPLRFKVRHLTTISEML